MACAQDAVGSAATVLTCRIRRLSDYAFHRIQPVEGVQSSDPEVA